jgi:phosphoglycerol transferase MdoB-like AlkP superfamily enzyme/glycerophosphoryl diester phosphodiesterase
VRVGLTVALFISVFAKLIHLGGTLDIGAYPEHRAPLAATLAVLLGAAGLVCRTRGRYDFAAAVALNGSLTVLALADIIHYRFYGDVLSIAEFTTVAQLGRVMPSLFSLLRVSDALLFADVTAAVLLRVMFGRQFAITTRTPRARNVGSAVATLAAVALSVFPASLVIRDPDAVFAYQTTRREVAVSIGLLPYHVYDAASFALFPLAGRLAVNGDRRYEALRVLRERPLTPRSPLFGRARQSNVILVMAESLAAFPIGLSWRGQPLAPALSRFASESLVFSNFFDQTHDGTTSDGEFTSLQSLHPLAAGAVATRYGANNFRGLPAILAEHGYHTFSASAEDGDFWNKRQMHPRLGFSRSFFSDRYVPGDSFGLGLADAEFFRQTLSLPDFEQQPFMAYLMTLSGHHPYQVPPRHRSLRLDELEGTLLGNYLHAVRYFDGAFGTLIEGLKDKGLLESSIVAVYGDHQPFWQNVHQLPEVLSFDKEDPFGAWRARERLAFLVRLPGGRTVRTFSRPGGQLDVAPTVLSLLGIPIDGEVLFGDDLTARRSGWVVPFRNGDFIAGYQACIRGPTELASGQCFDVRSGAAVERLGVEDDRIIARGRLAASDAIVHGDLIPYLRREIARRPLPSRPDLESLLTSRPAGQRQLVVIAHRGNSSEFPENTLAAIAGAAELGCDFAEVDVRLTADGVPVIMHDETIDRTTTGSGALAERTLAEVKTLDAGSWKDRRFAGERVPTLVEALRAARGKVRLILDVPVAGAARRIAAAVAEAGSRETDFVVAAWDELQRVELRRALPRAALIHAEGAPDAEGAWTRQFFETARKAGVRAFDVPNWSSGFIAAAHAHHMPVWAYTINDEAMMRQLIAIGIDGMETDVPRLAIQVARELGARR